MSLMLDTNVLKNMFDYKVLSCTNGTYGTCSLFLLQRWQATLDFASAAWHKQHSEILGVFFSFAIYHIDFLP